MSETTHRRRGRQAAGLVVAALTCLLALHVYARCVDSLHRLCFISGWALTIVTAVLALDWWFISEARCSRPRQSAIWQVPLSAVAIVLFGIHVGFRPPTGALDTVLAVLFGGTVLSLAGLVLAPHLGERGGSGRSWLVVHIAMLYSMLAIGLIHGVVMHTHGIAAHLILGK